MQKRHILGMLVEDHSGVLMRVAGLFARRGFNVETITVGKTTMPGTSRIVLTVIGNDNVLEQVKKQVNKLIDVIKVSEMEPEHSIIQELSLIKVKIRDEKIRGELLKYADIYKVKVADITPKSIIFQIVGDTHKIDSFIELVKKFGIEEVSRTGITAISRGIRTLENKKSKKLKN